ncbi:MAG: hypothetical protein RL208_732 [Pseudomonadota bacterium]|jgi:hypothetical protein
MDLKTRNIKIKLHYFSNPKQLLTTIIICLLFIITTITIAAIKYHKLKIVSIQYSQLGFLKEKLSTHNKIVVSYAKNVTNYINLNTEKQIIIKSLKGIMFQDDDIELSKSHITINNIRTRIYQGPTETIELNTMNNNFNIPKHMNLKNGKNNHITFEELHGNTKTTLITNKPFSIHDEDILVNGNEMTYNIITGDAIIKGNGTIKKQDLKTKQFDIIQGETIKIFQNKKYIESIHKTKTIHSSEIITSEYAKYYLAKNNQLKESFFANNVYGITKNMQITSDYAYYDSKNNITMFYQNVVTTNSSTASEGAVYIYDHIKEEMTIHNQSNAMKVKIYNIVLNKIFKEIALVKKDGTIKIPQLNTAKKEPQEKQEINENQRVKIVLDQEGQILDENDQ